MCVEMKNETRNERNFRLLKRRFEIQEEMESLMEMYGNEFVYHMVDGNEIKLWVVNGNEPVPVFENETLFLIENENETAVGIGIGKRVENEPNKAFENEIWFRNGNGIRNGFGNELGNGNGNEHENEHRNETRVGNGRSVYGLLCRLCRKLF